MKIKGKGPYRWKDELKAARCNKFIGHGAPGSATEYYRIQFGKYANCGMYSSTDVVFISTNGKRQGALPPLYDEIRKALTARATIITDKKKTGSENITPVKDWSRLF